MVYNSIRGIIMKSSIVKEVEEAIKVASEASDLWSGTFMDDMIRSKVKDLSAQIQELRNTALNAVERFREEDDRTDY